jgi:hypothetical protein
MKLSLWAGGAAWETSGAAGVIRLLVDKPESRLSNYTTPIPFVKLLAGDFLFINTDLKPGQPVALLTNNIYDTAVSFTAIRLQGGQDLEKIVFPSGSIFHLDGKNLTLNSGEYFAWSFTPTTPPGGTPVVRVFSGLEVRSVA